MESQKLTEANRLKKTIAELNDQLRNLHETGFHVKLVYDNYVSTVAPFIKIVTLEHVESYV